MMCHKIEIPYYSVENYAKICIHCGVKGTSRTLGNSIENYPKCIDCTDKPDIRRRKRNAVTENDLVKKNMYYFQSFFLSIFTSVFLCKNSHLTSNLFFIFPALTFFIAPKIKNKIINPHSALKFGPCYAKQNINFF